MIGRTGILCVVGMLAILPAAACADEAGDMATLRAELAALRAAQAAAAARISRLEGQLEAALARPVTAVSASAPVASPVATVIASAASRLVIGGDLRTRYELNFGSRNAPDRNREVLRARLRASYAAAPWLTIGMQLVLGDPDDPNTADLTLSDFDDDLPVALDQLYMRARFGGLTLTGGKFANPFTRTELVWDGDVNPQGLSASYARALGGGATARANGLYFIIQESAAGPDSNMVGGQVAVEQVAVGPARVDVAVGYYDYRLRDLTGADAGDFRSNRVVAGRYLSDFDLLDVVASLTYGGLGPRWPLRLTGDFVRNFGTDAARGTGFGVDFVAGRSTTKGDLRFTYGYAQTAVDAVFAAFSHDNLALATNYLQHTIAVDYRVANNILLNTTLYHYRPKDRAFAVGLPDDWLERLRLNLVVEF